MYLQDVVSATYPVVRHKRQWSLPYIQMEQAGPDKASNILLRLLNIAIFSSHILQYISACYA